MRSHYGRKFRSKQVLQVESASRICGPKERHRALQDRALKEGAIKEEYARFLKEEGLERTPDNAQTFAMRALKTDGYDGFNERQLIILVQGELPFMYD